MRSGSVGVPRPFGRLSALVGERSGAAVVEFGLVLPLLLLLLIGMVEFGLTLNNYIVLTEAVRAGGRQFAISRGAVDPFGTTVNEIYQAAPNLTQANLTITLSVNGTQCTDKPSCSNALANAQGEPVRVTASYPCNLAFLGFDFAPHCSLTSQITEIVE